MSGANPGPDEAAEPDGHARLRRRLDAAYPTLVRGTAVVVFFVFWEIAGRHTDPLFMTYPTAIARAFWQMTASGELGRALVATMEPFAAGMAISILGGVAIGLLIGQFRLAEYILDPFLDALYATPRIALIPLIILWFGLGLGGKVVIVVSIAMFPIIVNTYAGVRDVRGALLEIGRAYAATEWQIFAKIILPASLPFIMAGIRLSVALGIIGIMVAEFFSALRGVGGLIVIYANQFATAKMFVPIIVIAVICIALTQGVRRLERRLTAWRQSERSRH